MSSSERTASDAVLILESLARVLRISPHGESDDNAVQASYVDDSVGALIRDASLPSAELESARQYGGGEWDTALLFALFPGADLAQLAVRLRALRTSPQ